jgi:hypothetical protein
MYIFACVHCSVRTLKAGRIKFPCTTVDIKVESDRRFWVNLLRTEKSTTRWNWPLAPTFNNIFEQSKLPRMGVTCSGNGDVRLPRPTAFDRRTHSSNMGMKQSLYEVQNLRIASVMAMRASTDLNLNPKSGRNKRRHL